MNAEATAVRDTKPMGAAAPGRWSAPPSDAAVRAVVSLGRIPLRLLQTRTGRRLAATAVLSLLLVGAVSALYAHADGPATPPRLLTDRASPGFPLARVGTAVSRVIHQTLATPRSKPSARSVPAVAKASAFALADIPSGYLGLYIQAAHTCPALTWQLLAGIGKVETNHGRTPAPGVHSGVNTFGCCAGPMQFNIRNGPPSTWDTYGDGQLAHVYQPQYAIPAAAHKLCTDGLANPDQPIRDPCPGVRGSPAQHPAILRYTRACWYAHPVLALAARYTT